MRLRGHIWLVSLGLVVLPLAAVAQSLELSAQPPLTAEDQAFNAKILADEAAAEAHKGPLDGVWTLKSAEEGAALYAFLLSDQVNGPVEGAWRDLRRNLTVTSSGFIAEIHHDEEALSLRFYVRDEAHPVLVRLSPDERGRWRGTLTDEAGHKFPGSLERN
jgi:hypothetical protein